MEGAVRVVELQPPCHGHPPDRAAQGPILCLKNSRDSELGEKESTSVHLYMDTECLCSDLPVFYSMLVGTTAESAEKSQGFTEHTEIYNQCPPCHGWQD